MQKLDYPPLQLYWLRSSFHHTRIEFATKYAKIKVNFGRYIRMLKLITQPASNSLFTWEFCDKL